MVDEAMRPQTFVLGARKAADAFRVHPFLAARAEKVAGGICDGFDCSKSLFGLSNSLSCVSFHALAGRFIEGMERFLPFESLRMLELFQ